MKKLDRIKMHLISFFTSWKTLNSIPPNERVQVKDINGNVAFADPTYYPFELKKLEGDERKPFGWRATPIFYEDGVHRWDGGWMIVCEGLSSNIGYIVLWRPIKKKQRNIFHIIFKIY